MSTPTNIPETPMGEPEQDSYTKSKEKFQQQLQDIFQTILTLIDPDQFDQLCQWMENKQYRTIDDFYDNSCYDPEKPDTNGPAIEYKWKGKMNYLSANVAQKLKSFVKWMAHEYRPYELHDDFLATLTRDHYLKFRHLDSQSFKSFHHHHLIMNPTNTKSRKDLRERHSSLNKKKSVMMMKIPMKKSNIPLIQNQRNILHIQLISHHLTPRSHKSLFYLPTSGKHLLDAPKR